MKNNPLNIFPLKAGRVHEVCGPSAAWFTLTRAAQSRGPVFWVAEQWNSQKLNPLGIVNIVSLENMLSVVTKDQSETLAAAEDTLRSGTVPCVIMVLSAPLDLTAGRRLQIAARAGGTTGLAIIPVGAGSTAAETRWHCSPLFDPKDSTLQRWELIKNKSGTLGVWNVRWSESSHRINVVSETGE